MGFVIPEWPVPAVPVVGTEELFPVRRIFCVGQNYAAHAREMGSDPDRRPPCFFTKPADSIHVDGSPVPYPPATADLHHEVELVVAIGKPGRMIESERALAEHVYGYAVGLDFTRRDLQAAAKAAGLPWDMAKGFDHAAPLGAIQPATAIGHPASGAITLSVNGEARQSGDLADMIWPVADIIAQLSRLITLQAGDLIFTGTPSGVGAVRRGDAIEGTIAGVGTLTVTLV